MKSSMKNCNSVGGKSLRISESPRSSSSSPRLSNHCETPPGLGGQNVKKTYHEKEEQFKDILRRNRGILLRNLTVSGEMTRMFREHKIFTDSMLQEIASSKSRINTVKLILQLLPLRGPAMFQVFCDILLLSGHSILGELLKDEGGIATVQVDVSDLSTRYPIIDRNLRPTDRYDLSEYIQDKIKDYLMRQRLLGAGEKRDYSQDLKQQIIEMTWAHQKEIQQRDALMKEIEQKTIALKSSLDQRISDLKSIIAEQNRTQDKLKEELKIQYNFNLANDKSLQRYQQKLEAQDRLLVALCNRWKENGYFWEHGGGGDDVTAGGEQTLDVTQKFERFLKRVRELEDYKNKYAVLVREQNRLLGHVMSNCDLEADENSDESLLHALTDHIHKKDLTISNLQADASEFKNRIAYLENRHKEVVKEFETMQTKAMELEYKMNCSSDSDRESEPDCRHRKEHWKKKVSYDYESELVRLKEVVDRKDATINLLEFEISRLRQELESGGGDHGTSRLNGLVTTRDRTRLPPKPHSAKKQATKLPPLKIPKDDKSAKSSPGAVSEFVLNGWEQDSIDEHLSVPDAVPASPSKQPSPVGKNLPPGGAPTFFMRQSSVTNVNIGHKFNRGETLDLSAIHQKLIEPEF